VVLSVFSPFSSFIPVASSVTPSDGQSACSSAHSRNLAFEKGNYESTVAPPFHDPRLSFFSFLSRLHTCGILHFFIYRFFLVHLFRNSPVFLKIFSRGKVFACQRSVCPRSHVFASLLTPTFLFPFFICPGSSHISTDRLS